MIKIEAGKIYVDRLGFVHGPIKRLMNGLLADDRNTYKQDGLMINVSCHGFNAQIFWS